jgi:hypothetical protein
MSHYGSSIFAHLLVVCKVPVRMAEDALVKQEHTVSGARAHKVVVSLAAAGVTAYRCPRHAAHTTLLQTHRAQSKPMIMQQFC